MYKDFYENSKNLNRAIKKIVTFVVAIIFMFGCTYVPGGELVEEAHAAGGGADYVEGEVIVCYIDTDDMDLTARQERKADQLLGDAEEIATVENVSLADVSVDESKLTEEVQEAEEVDKTIAAVTSDDKSTEELIEEIEKLPNVDYVEPNYIFKLTEAEAEGEAMTADELEESEEAAAGDEPLAEEEATEENEAELEGTELNASPNYTGLQWAYKKSYGLYVPDWNNPDKKNSEGTVVAVIDSGVDYTHEDLDDVMWSDGNGKHGYDFCNEDSDPMDDNGHGTHCAGIIAAEWNGIGVSGTANGTKIMAVKAASAEGYLDYWDILCSYDYIINQKKRGVNIVAINNSWGSGAESSYGLDEMVTEAGNLGMVSVFSSGNDGRNCDESHTFQSGEGPFTGHYFCYFMKDNPYAIVVDSIASSDTSDSCYLSDFSNYGSGSTDLAAPGSKIVSTVPDNKYLYYSGTSMAAPAVTAEAAIVSKKFSGETADVIVSIITHNTTESSAVKGKCKSNGLANVGKALEAKPKDIKYRDFALDTTEYTYDGTEKRPTVSVSRLKEGTDYEVVDSPEESIDAGTYSVLVNSKGDYDGSLELIYKINQVKPEVSLSSEAFTYDGGTKTVSVKVTGADGEEWEQDVDYSQEGTLSAKLPGSYSITVTPGDSWNYETITRSFTINVKPAGISKLSRLKKGFKVKASKQASKYVSGYQVRYSRNSDMSGASTKTIGTKYYRNTKSVKKLKKKTTYYVQVRTYKTIGGKKYYSAWSSTKSVKTK